MSISKTAVLGLFFLLNASQVRAQLLRVELGFGSLPSAQGFVYTGQIHDGSAIVSVPESEVFSADGTTLVQNSLGQPAPVNRFSHRRVATISREHPVQLQVNARCLEFESFGFPEFVQPGAFTFGFANGVVEYGFLITPVHVGIRAGSGWQLSAPIYDNTPFHDYRFEWSPGGVWQLWRDDEVVFSGSSGRLSNQSFVEFGDLEGGSNARGEIRSLVLTQDVPVPAAATSWGRIKRLYR